MTYSKRFYDFQTEGRGIQDAASLRKLFKKLSKYYWARLRKYIPKNKNSMCLDVASGYGNFVYMLNARGYFNVIGCDTDKKQVYLASLLNLPVKTADAFELLSKDQKYDLISAFDFIEHLSKDSAIKFLDECFLSLKKDGCLILRVPSMDSPFGAHDAFNDITHEWAMTSTLLKAVLTMCGFNRVTILDERPQPTSFINFFRWVAYFFAKSLANIFCILLGVRPPKVWSRSMILVAYKG